MTIMSQLAVIFGVCLISEGISALLPFQFPASVISMMLLLVLLLTGVVKDRHIDKASNFFVTNMSFFFVAPCVSVMDHFPKLVDCLLPFLFISVVTTPVVYCATAWSTQLLMALVDKKEAQHD